MQHAKTRLFSVLNICHKSTFKSFYCKIKIFHANRYFSIKLFVRKIFSEMKQILA